jgi:hypothetical protein
VGKKGKIAERESSEQIMKGTWRLYVMLAVIVLAATVAQAEFSVRLKVVDSAGKLIPEFEVMVHTHDEGYISWKQGKDGEMWLRSGNHDFPDFPGLRRTARYQIIIRAPNLAPYIIELDRPDRDVEQIVTLSEGRRVELILTTADNRPIPDELVPTVIFSEYEDRILSGHITYDGKYRPYRDAFNFASPVKIKSGHYAFNIPEDLPEIYVLIDHVGFLRAFRAGPFTQEDLAGGTLKVELPAPSTLEIVSDPPKGLKGALPYRKCHTTVGQEVPEKPNSARFVAFADSNEPHLHIAPEYYPPGRYWVQFTTRPTDDSVSAQIGKINPAYFWDMKKFSLEAGQHKKLVFEYIPYDPNIYKGPYNAVLNIRWHNGKPAAGLPYTISYRDSHYVGSQMIAEGTIPDNGRIELAGVRGGAEGFSYHLELDNGNLGQYFFQLLGEEKTRELEYKIASMKDDMAPDITVLDIFTGDKVKFSDFRGKVLFVEFWATWCGPCQGPTAHLCEIPSKRKDDWAGKALLLCISIDDKKEDVIRHVRSRGWLAVRHLWCEEGEPGFNSVGAKTYAITGVPTALLIDQSGRIVWRGHPGSFDIEANIDKLLTDK